MPAGLGDLTVGSREDAAALDATDPLAPLRARFRLPEGVIYLDGNSLGALPASVKAAVLATLRAEWGRNLIRAWDDDDWWDLPVTVGDRIGRLLGAAPGQVVAADSTSVNLYKLLHVAQQLRPGRARFVTEEGGFPTDAYLVERVAGPHVDVVARGDLPGALGDDVAALVLTHVDYRSGARHDLAGLTAAAHASGALALWDLSHSVGAVPLALDEAAVDLAVGCSYKYLNGGPGAPAWCYVAHRHQPCLPAPMPGWIGHADPFAMEARYRPAAGVRRLLVGTPPILALRALDAALDAFEGVTMTELRAKSVGLTELFLERVDARVGLPALTPRQPEQRGSQVSLRHPQAAEVMAALIARGVIGDVRPPDVLRFGFAPLYLRYVDVWDAVEVLADVGQTGQARSTWFGAST
jgi:kynureninase